MAWLELPIIFSMIDAITILAKKAFHPNVTYCFIGADPTCDDLDCDGGTDAKVLFIVFSAAPLILLPCVIAATMAIMYQAVLAQKKKLQM